MRSRFLDEMGVPKTDLRKNYCCAICGIKITSKNFESSSSRMGENGWEEVKVYCEECYLKPEVFE